MTTAAARAFAMLFLAGALAAACGGRTAALRWWMTCGDPVGGLGHRDAGLPACTTETVGAACAPAGAECDPGNADNSELLCSATDPRQGPGGCPISRAAFKKDIRYLDAGELRALHDQLLDLPLATWRYREEPPSSRLHLGFVIDGHESLACVDAGRDQVDLYGYASMAVAALQAQEQEIAALRAEVAELRAALRSGTAPPGAPRRR